MIRENGEPVRASAAAKLGVSVLAFIVAWLIAEGVLRVFWENPYGSNSVQMIVELRTPARNLVRNIDRTVLDKASPVVTYRTDERGYIKPSRRFPKPDHTVAFLGGSTTECLFVAENLRFPARTSFLLEQHGLKVNALNMGVSGNNTHHSVDNLFNYVVNDHPDVVVLMEAVNDAGHLKWFGNYGSAMGSAPGFGTLGRLLFTRASAYSSVLGLVRHTRLLIANKQELELMRTGREVRPWKGPPPIEEFRRRLRTFIGVSRAFRITPVLMTQPSDNRRSELTPSWFDSATQTMFNQAIREVAAEERADLIDLDALVKEDERRAGKNRLFYDAVHVTDYGSQVYARHVAGQLLEILQASRR